MMPEIMGELAEREREISALRHDVAERLRAVCAGWPEDAMEQLVQRIADITYKYNCIRDRDMWLSSDRWRID
jgi:hypothetical protein